MLLSLIRCERIVFCRLDSTYNPEIARITIAAKLPEIEELVIESFAVMGWDRKHGKAPASRLEREVQAWLESFLK